MHGVDGVATKLLPYVPPHLPPCSEGPGCALQFGFNLFPEVQRSFNQTYRCYSVSMLPGNEREDVEKGGKSEYNTTCAGLTFSVQNSGNCTFLL